MQNKIVAITGASSGIGFATAKKYLDKGCKVYNLSRTPSSANGIINLTCDVTSQYSIEEAFEQIAASEGKIDVLILNAGYGISGAVETTPTDKAKWQFAVNFFGTFECFKAAMPLLCKSTQKQPKIIIVSSLAGVIPIPFQAFYSASKAALCSLARCLASELKSQKIGVTAVLPGDVKTAFTAKRIKNKEPDKYKGSASNAVGTMEKDENNGLKPETVATLIYKLSQKKRLGPYYTAGFVNKLFLFLARIMPPAFVDWVVRIKYKI